MTNANRKWKPQPGCTCGACVEVEGKYKTREGRSKSAPIARVKPNNVIEFPGNRLKSKWVTDDPRMSHA